MGGSAMAQTSVITKVYTKEDKEQTVRELCELWKGKNWQSTFNELLNEKDRPKTFITEDTIDRILGGNYSGEGMRDTTYKAIVWMIDRYKNKYLKKDYNTLLEQSSINFPPELQQFIDPKLDSIQSIADPMVGNYQGYRLSIARPGYVIRFNLTITFDEEKNVLLTKETVLNEMIKAKEDFEGACVVNLAHTGIRYFLTRIRKNLEVTGLLLTVIYDYVLNEQGEISSLSGVVSGLNVNGPFAGNVIYIRQDKIKTDFISEADLLAEDSKNEAILTGLRRRIDMPS